jgi:RNA polymerase sigma-70 factor, ECF subfamily
MSELARSDEELVLETLRTPSSFGFLIERYEAKLRRYISRLGVRGHEDQQDVLQDIFIKTYRNLNGFDTSLSFSSWIYRIAHNESISWYRKQNIRPEGNLVADSDEILALIESKELSHEDKFDQKLDAKALTAAMAKLDMKYQEVLVLRFFEHKEYEEISDILKIPIGTVGTLITRGKKRLQDELKAENKRTN